MAICAVEEIVMLTEPFARDNLDTAKHKSVEF